MDPPPLKKGAGKPTRAETPLQFTDGHDLPRGGGGVGAWDPMAPIPGQ